MAENIPLPELTADGAKEALEVLQWQEQMLRYAVSFTSDDAIELGCIVASLAPEFGEGRSVTITRESDGVRMFQWVADDKGERNLQFAEGKRQAALAAGHAGPWSQLEAVVAGDVSQVWAKVPDVVPACGAFPIRVGDEWVATIAVSGLSNGEDHEIILRAFEQALSVTVPRWSAPVA